MMRTMLRSGWLNLKRDYVALALTFVLPIVFFSIFASVFGGSMFPRFLMPETMQKIGLATFNGWAIDGYRKVFHLDQPVVTLWPQVLVLAVMAAAFLGIARVLARRWEAV